MLCLAFTCLLDTAHVVQTATHAVYFHIDASGSMIAFVTHHFSSGACPMTATRRPRAADTQLQSALEARLRLVFQGSIWKKRDATAFVEALYADDAFATSEGSSQSWRGTTQLTELATGVMKKFRAIRFHRVRTCGLGPRGATQFVAVDAYPRNKGLPMERYKCLFTWRRARSSWRVVHDMTAKGGVKI